MTVRSLWFAILASFATVASAHSAMVTASTPVTFAFDTSALATPFNISSFTFACVQSCPAGPNAAAPESLHPTGIIQFDFGTTPGASDLGSQQWLNPVNAYLTIATNQPFPDGSVQLLNPLTTLFITFLFVNDEFGIDELGIATTSGPVDGILLINEIPLPAALPLFLAGLAITGWIGRRRNKPLALKSR